LPEALSHSSAFRGSALQARCFRIADWSPLPHSSLPPQLALTLWLAIAALAISAVCVAAPRFPPLTGRVVDEAELLSPPARERLTRMLDEYERTTTNQVVVVTLRSLQGYPIEDFGYQLGRHWGIGQKGKDNGVLLIVAPNERAVRIEVGYGLEGTLTDALSHDIIETRILPAFRRDRYEQGIVQGTEAILAVLGGRYQPQAKPSRDGAAPYLQIVVMLLLLGILVHAFVVSPPTGRGRRRGVYWGGGYRGGGGFTGGGGFSGGGGSFGGGGASGGW
jgi:uncharacterized protein